MLEINIYYCMKQLDRRLHLLRNRKHLESLNNVFIRLLWTLSLKFGALEDNRKQVAPVCTRHSCGRKDRPID